jgi:UDP-N-acetyl-D-mannosaminuronic acid transferase (WecB/TagA/CpsF family)
MADFVEALANAAHKNGDTLGVFGAAEQILPKFSYSPSRWPGLARQLADRLRRTQAQGVGC